MKAKRLLIFLFIFSVLGTGVVYASNEYSNFTKANVNINKTELTFDDVPAIIMDGRVLMPLRSLTNSLQALVQWDSVNKVANIYKPNVHMIVTTEVSSKGSNIIEKVVKGSKGTIAIFAQVDSVATKIHSYKIEIIDPNNNPVSGTLKEEVIASSQEDSFSHYSKFNVNFDIAGNYRIHFSMKINESDEYTVISEKVIKSE